MGGGVKNEGGRVGGETEEEVATVDKACGAVTWAGVRTGVAFSKSLLRR